MKSRDDKPPRAWNSTWVCRVCDGPIVPNAKPSAMAKRKTCGEACRAEWLSRVHLARPKLPPDSAAIAARFWANVTRGDGCWEWRGPIAASGYGQMSIQHRRVQAHRLSYRINVGPIPDGLHVCHRCDNPPCVRPDHLFLGTDADNQADKVRKGRHRPGEQHGQAKLSDEQVRAIRARAPIGERQHEEVAREFGVSLSSVYKILQRRTWRHLPL